MSKVFILRDATVRRRACAFLMDDAQADDIVTISKPSKTRPQESLAHCMYDEFAEHADIHGQRMSAEDWKRKLKLDFYDETGAEYPELWEKCKPTLTPVPGTRYVVASEIPSRRFPRELYRLYIEFLQQQAAEHGIPQATERAQVATA